MTEKNDREPQQAELLWKYVEELKQAEDPEDVQFVAVTSGGCAEVVGLMETAAEVQALARAEWAPHCRREAIRRRLHDAMPRAPATTLQPRPAAARTGSANRPAPLPARLAVLLMGRTAGWAVAVSAFAALVWLAAQRPQLEGAPPAPVAPVHCAQAVAAVPALIAGTLDVDKARAVWAHLNRCKECLDYYELRWRQAHPDHRRTGQSRRPEPPSTLASRPTW